MSRIGRLPIVVSAQVKVTIQDGRISVAGPKGHLDFRLPPFTAVSLESGQLKVTRVGEDARSRAMHGLARAIINNMVRGVTDGFAKKLEIQGVGFKASVQGRSVNMSLGYSHPITYDIPDQIKIVVEDNTKISIEGPDRQLVGQVASELRSFYPPEPYKGKGVRYVGEKVIRKEGKTVQ